MPDISDFYEDAPKFENVKDDIMQITEKGLETLVEWVKYSIQLHEMTHEDGDMSGQFDEVPYLVGFLLPEICFYRDIPIPGAGEEDDF